MSQHVFSTYFPDWSQLVLSCSLVSLQQTYRAQSLNRNTYRIVIIAMHIISAPKFCDIISWGPMVIPSPNWWWCQLFCDFHVSCAFYVGLKSVFPLGPVGLWGGQWWGVGGRGAGRVPVTQWRGRSLFQYTSVTAFDALFDIKISSLL